MLLAFTLTPLLSYTITWSELVVRANALAYFQDAASDICSSSEQVTVLNLKDCICYVQASTGNTHQMRWVTFLNSLPGDGLPEML